MVNDSSWGPGRSTLIVKANVTVDPSQVLPAAPRCQLSAWGMKLSLLQKMKQFSSLFCYMTWFHSFFTTIFCTIWKPNSVPVFLFNPLPISFLYFTLSLQVCPVTVCSCGLEERSCITGVSYKFLEDYNFSRFSPHRSVSTIFISTLYPFYNRCHCRLVPDFLTQRPGFGLRSSHFSISKTILPSSSRSSSFSSIISYLFVTYWASHEEPIIKMSSIHLCL
jgi:hypothetical protein